MSPASVAAPSHRKTKACKALLSCGEGSRKWPHRASVVKRLAVRKKPTILCDNPKHVLLCLASSDLASPEFDFDSLLNVREEIEKTACPRNHGLSY
jgi:hypothetical protein